METLDATPLRIETLDGGLASGGPSVGLIIELPPEGAPPFSRRRA